MPRMISSKLTLLAGACALSLAFAPNALAAGGAGGGGGHMGGTMAAAPMTARPMVAPMDHKTGPNAQDVKSHAPFNKLNGPASTPQPASTSESTHGPVGVSSPPSRPQPVTGTRIPPSMPQQQIQVDPPPPGHGSVN